MRRVGGRDPPEVTDDGLAGAKEHEERGRASLLCPQSDAQLCGFERFPGG
jgi:hypothetical protein